LSANLKGTNRCMKRLKRSVDLNAYIRDCAFEPTLLSSDKEGNTTLTIHAAFGTAQDDDEKASPDDFKVDEVEWADLLASQMELDDPRDQFNKKKEAQSTKDSATAVQSYLVKMYNDPDSFLFHGCTNEMMRLIYQTLVVDTAFVRDVVRGNVYPPPDNFKEKMEYSLELPRNSNQVEGLGIEKNKFPPIVGSNGAPGMNAWLQTSNGRDHRSTGNNKRGGSSGLAGMVIDIIRTRQQQEQMTCRSEEVVRDHSRGDRSGRIHIHIGDNAKDVSAQYSKVFYGAGAGENNDIDTPLWAFLKQARHPSEYDRDLEERVFKVLSNSAAREELGVCIEYSKEDAQQVTLRFVLNTENIQKGEVLTILSTFKDKHFNRGDGGISD
jgi:hypothetical protein